MNLKLKTRLRSLLLGLSCCLCLALTAQDASVTGTITDVDGEPLIGVNITVQGSSKGTLTDIDGQFQLLFPNNERSSLNLLISYIGYATQIVPVNLSTETNVRLAIQLEDDITNLGEIVVTGTSAATSKKQLGNAISTIDSRQIGEVGATSLDQALTGKLSGALISQNSGNPAGGISITLRGISTVLGSSDPLYIIDGVIMDNSSTELIDLGGYTQNRLVDINPNDIDRVEIIKGAAAAAIYGSRASNGVVQIFTKKGKSGKPSITFSTSFRVNELRKEIEENMEPQRYETPTDPLNSALIPAERFKMQDYIFSTGIGTDNYISMRGGSDDTRYFFSGSALYNQGIIDNTDFSRYTARMNLDQIVNSWLSASVGLGYTYSNSNEVPNGGLGEFYGALTGFNFNNNFYDPEPDADGNYNSPAGFVANPLEAIETYDFGQNTSRFNGNIQLKATITDNLSAEYILGFDTYVQRAEGFIPVGSNQRPTGWSRVAQTNRLLLNNDINLRYATNLGDNVQSTSLLGATLQYDQARTLGITADRLSPVVVSTNGGTAIGLGDSRSERTIQGAFFQQTFGFNNKLFLTGAVRLDAASTFGIDERNQFYPKVSASYLVLDGNTGFANTVKVRASYGESGNLSALSAFERFSNYFPVVINGTTGLVPSTQQGNADLRPERQRELEFGIDAGLLNNRLGVELTYYRGEVEDLLLTRTLSLSTGYSTRLENVGNLENSGIELLLRASPVRTDKIDWKVIATYSTNTNEVNGIEGDLIRLPKSFGVSVARNGEPIGVLDGFYYARDDNGEILLDDDGLPTRGRDEDGNIERLTIGDPNPDWIGSLINEVSMGAWSFRLQFDAQQGFDIFNFTDRVNSRSSFGGGVRDAREIRGDLPRGFNNAAYNIWERYIEDGSFVKLRELSVRYRITPQNKNIRGITLALIGRNLLSFDNYSGWDPETSAAGQQNGVRGFDFNEVPIPRTYQFSLTFDL